MHPAQELASPRLTDHSRFLPLAVLAALTITASTCRASVDTSTWCADGPVFAELADGSTLYIGGAFARVGPLTGSGVPISAGTLAPATGFPRVVGSVNAIAGDGAGGWYIGGSFTFVG